jgi:hypothetical protein
VKRHASGNHSGYRRRYAVTAGVIAFGQPKVSYVTVTEKVYFGTQDLKLISEIPDTMSRSSGKTILDIHSEVA